MVSRSDLLILVCINRSLDILSTEMHGAIMSDRDINGEAKTNKEDVTASNVITSESFKELSNGSTVYEGLLLATNRVYRGQIKYKYWWGNNGGMFYCYATHYTINDPDRFGRNKANIHFSFDSQQWWGVDSPDSMRQDDQWNVWEVGGYIGANKRARVYVRFDFDLPFSDVSGESSNYHNYPGA